MVDIRRVEVSWVTGIGGSGLSVFHSADADDATADIGAFFNTIKSALPTGISVSVPSSGDKIDVATGTLTGGWSGGTAATIAATGGAAYAAGTGTYVRWGTGLIVNGRRLKGRTFICPLIVGAYAADGTIEAVWQAILQPAATTLAATGKIGIWHRPDPDHPTAGAFSTVTSGTFPDRVTSLRSRRG